VDAIDLEVGSGEFVTLLGPSGSGKTTTLMMVAGFTPPSAGEIAIDDRPITGMAPERRNIGVVFQNYALFPHMTVFDNVAFPLRMRRQSRASIRARVEHALGMVHLAGLGGRLPRELSGGQQQRVALARALVFDPGLLLMDEPLGALDRNLREQMKAEIRRIHSDVGVTVLYVTHDQEEALTMSDRVALMNRGRIAQLGSAEDVAPGGLRLPVRVAGPAPRPGERATLMLRPEKIALAPAGAAASEPATLLGEFAGYRVRVGSGIVLGVKAANTHAAWRAKPGDPVLLRWAATDGYLVPPAA